MFFRRCLAAGSLALLTAHPAAAEVVAKSEAGFVSRNAVEVKATPAAAWQTLIAPSQWWNAEHSFSGDAANLYIDPQAGGCFCEKLPAKDDAVPGARLGSVLHMTVIHAAPGAVLRLSGGLEPLQSEAVGGTLSITLKSTPGGTRILWEYVVGGYMRHKVDEIAPAVDKVMAEQLSRLSAKLGEGEGGPKPVEAP